MTNEIDVYAQIAQVKEAPVLKCSQGEVAFQKLFVLKNLPNNTTIEQEVFKCIRCNKLFPYCTEIGNIPRELISECIIAEHKNLIIPDISGILGK